MKRNNKTVHENDYSDFKILLKPELRLYGPLFYVAHSKMVSHIYRMVQKSKSATDLASKLVMSTNRINSVRKKNFS